MLEKLCFVDNYCHFIIIFYSFFIIFVVSVCVNMLSIMKSNYVTKHFQVNKLFKPHFISHIRNVSAKFLTFLNTNFLLTVEFLWPCQLQNSPCHMHILNIFSILQNISFIRDSEQFYYRILFYVNQLKTWPFNLNFNWGNKNNLLGLDQEDVEQLLPCFLPKTGRLIIMCVWSIINMEHCFNL